MTNDPVLFDRMLVLGHYGRLKHGSGTRAPSTPITSASASSTARTCTPSCLRSAVSRGSRSSIGGVSATTTSCARSWRTVRRSSRSRPRPDATRGGFLEFILKYAPEHAGGWNSRAFVHAARAEGVPIEVERYARIGDRGRMLHETPIFSDARSEPAWWLSRRRTCRARAEGDHDLPVVRGLADRLFTLPAFTDVPERFVRACAAALRKVAACAAEMGGRSMPADRPDQPSHWRSRRHGVLDAGSRAGARVPARSL